MKDGAPDLHELMVRLRAVPAELLLVPRTIGPKGVVRGVVHVDALVNDTVLWLGGNVALPFIRNAVHSLANALPAREGALRLAMLAVWLFHDPMFRGRAPLAESFARLVDRGLDRMAGAVTLENVLVDTERHEEFVRTCLTAVGLCPGGESKEVAAERLIAIDSVARAEAMHQATMARARAENVRRAAEASAKEAANYYGRE